mmetsp:Transcript_10656/g.19699  ORF Transcript_10656/g.19699 Transcript_10656/m.19699 type:complete len:321 (+) Transcript_10656:1932-2894(+)
MDDFNKLLAAHAQSGGKRSRGGPESSVSASRGGSHKKSRASRPRATPSASSASDDRCLRAWRRAWSSSKLLPVKGKYLAIVAAGDGSLHAESEWPPELELCVVYYGTGAKRDEFRKAAKYFFEVKGPKWQLVKFALKRVPWREYEYTWLPDDDLRFKGEEMGRMLSIASDHEILLGQPALLDKNIQRQYRELLLVRPELILHYVNFVEVMCPFLRVDVLESVIHAFTEDCKSGWGLDVYWPTVIDFSRIAVIDATPIEHTRPQNAFSVDSSFYKMYKIDPQREMYDLQRRLRFRDFRKKVFKLVALPSECQSGQKSCQES